MGRIVSEMGDEERMEGRVEGLNQLKEGGI